MNLKALLATSLVLTATIGCWGTPGKWQYRNTQYGFDVQLPSQQWKQIPYPGGLVAFKDPTATTQVGIQVRSESNDHYDATVRNFHHLTGTMPNLLQKPRTEQGKTSHGNTFAYIEVIEMNPEDQPVVIGISHLRLKRQGLTVVTTFQGHLTVHGTHMDRTEINLKEAQAHSICLSVDHS